MAMRLGRRDTGSAPAEAAETSVHGVRRNEVLARQRAAHGGIKWGAAFFGWLSANGLAVILIALASAAGTALGLTQFQSTTEAGQAAARAARNADTVGLVSGLVLLVVIGLAYYAGGYVASRMARLQGARQGVAVWLVGLVVTAVLAAAGAVLGAQYNVLSRLNLPRIPVNEGTLTTGGLIALLAVLVVTLVCAVLGGLAGQRYHRKLDRAGLEPYR